MLNKILVTGAITLISVSSNIAAEETPRDVVETAHNNYFGSNEPNGTLGDAIEKAEAEAKK